MKVKLLAGLIAAAASLMAGQAQAGAVGIANMNVTGLGFAAPGAPTITITNESRTGSATSDYNGVAGTNVGPSSQTLGGAVTVDITNRCAGACNLIPGGTYNGTGTGGRENATNHIAVPGSANYALGDMFISGTALSGSVVGGNQIAGLTRADAVATGPNNGGGANATILNSGRLTGTFQVGTTFTSAIALQVDAFIQAWIDPAGDPSNTTSASAGYSWNINITGSDGTSLNFAPADLNKSFSASDSLFNAATKFSTGGPALYFSDVRTYTAGVIYQFTINQSSNATVSEKSPLPEPAGLALVSIAVLGAGVASRRRKSA